MRKKSLFLIILVFFVLIYLNASQINTISLFQTKSTKATTTTATTTLGPIFIDGISQLIPYTSTGNGSLHNPYIVKNLAINCGSQTVGLHIINIDAYMIVTNITAQNCYYGLQFENVTHGTLSNSYVTTSTFGIEIDSSLNLTIQDNYLYDNDHGGFLISNTSSSVIQDNVVNKTLQIGAIGISMNSECYYDNVSSNIVISTNYWGYDLELSNSLVQNNTAIASNIGFYIVSSYTDYIHNQAFNQSIGFEIYFGMVSNNSFTYNLAFYDFNGFFIYDSIYNIYEQNNASYNKNDGFYLYIAYSDVFSNNTVTHNKANGFELVGTSNITITDNTVTDNTIDLNEDNTNSNNTIYGNSFNKTTPPSSTLSTSTNPQKSTTTTSKNLSMDGLQIIIPILLLQSKRMSKRKNNKEILKIEIGK